MHVTIKFSIYFINIFSGYLKNIVLLFIPINHNQITRPEIKKCSIYDVINFEFHEIYEISV